ncbi:2'-5' RNA ligase family protein [Planomicrobium sp. Y74]|uniref:2'-5' RNA ligase family protein n=1 Tax=Planomicrobium sp. Y74 TaxID=2478977 RepID=UPI000EF515AF|nr:2'-5' RNA ligase family protein [Planomicrobium sp. Y74]RLQ89838.1 2'-5' RNA ligase family protein [Planomicrobium sp. Y74]
MYWVVALFDEKTEQRIEEIWKGLSDNNISFYGEEIKDGRPHLTLGSYSELAEHEFIRLMDEFYTGRRSFDITFNAIGTFLNYKTLFLSPTLTKELSDFHTHHHKHFRDFNSTANTYYLPGEWIPHCTLANKVSNEKLSQAFNFCLERQQTLHGKVTEIALIKLIEEKGGIIDAPIIYSKRLNG